MLAFVVVEAEPGAEGTWCCRECRFSSEPVGSLARWRGIASRGDISPSRNLRRVTRYRGFESSSLQQRVTYEPENDIDIPVRRAQLRRLADLHRSSARQVAIAASVVWLPRPRRPMSVSISPTSRRPVRSPVRDPMALLRNMVVLRNLIYATCTGGSRPGHGIFVVPACTLSSRRFSGTSEPSVKWLTCSRRVSSAQTSSGWIPAFTQVMRR
jgi:hypothetical protein